MKAFFDLRVRGMSIAWLLFSLAYLSYLHGAWYDAPFSLMLFFLPLLLFLTFFSLTLEFVSFAA